MNVPYWLLRLLPMWDYICPRCRREVHKNSHKCPYCGEHFPFPLKVPPRCLQDNKALEEYVHKHIFPKVSAWQREYLAQYFTTIFSDGFESGDFSAWTGTSGTPTIVTSPVHHGTYAAQFNASAEYITKTITAVDLIYVRVYFQSANYPSSNTDDRFTIFRVGTTGATYPHFIQWRRDSSGNVCWRVSPGGGATRFIYNPAPTLNTWYCVELMCKIGTTDGEARTYINGVEVDTQTELNNSGGGSINQINVGLTTVVGTVPTITEDCVVVADAYIGPEAPPISFESYIQTYSEGAGKKFRYRQRTVGENTVYEQVMQIAQEETYILANSTPQTHAQNLHFISLFNGSGSGKKIVIKDITWRNARLSAITNPTAIQIDVKRITAQGSGGTTLTPQKFDSQATNIPSQITALQAPTTPPTEDVALLPLYINQEEVQVDSEWAHSLYPIFGRGTRKHQCQQIVLREGEGITIKEISAPGSAAGASAFTIIFTLE